MPKSNLFVSFSNSKEIKLKLCEKYSLNTNEILIYTVYLPNFIYLKLDLTTFLNTTELNRAERFHKEIDRNRFNICRLILKFSFPFLEPKIDQIFN